MGGCATAGYAQGLLIVLCPDIIPGCVLETTVVQGMEPGLYKAITLPTIYFSGPEMHLPYHLATKDRFKSY